MGSNASFPRVRLSKGRIIVVTGASSGLGYEVAKWCAMLGATVILACRSEQKTNDAIERMNKESMEERTKDASGLIQDDTLALEYMHVELSSFKSVVSFTEEYKRSGRKLHVLFLNAAHGLHPYRQTEDGLESVLQVNYLSQFLIVTKLLPVMKHSGDDCRILFMTSLAHRNCTFDLDTINYEGNPGNFRNNEYYIVDPNFTRNEVYQEQLWEETFKFLKDYITENDRAMMEGKDTI